VTPHNHALHLSSSATTAGARAIMVALPSAGGGIICGKARSSIEERCSQVSAGRSADKTKNEPD
jgi:hypothetical protein